MSFALTPPWFCLMPGPSNWQCNHPPVFLTSGDSVDLYVTTEDLPDPENRVLVGGNGGVQIRWKPNNLTSHAALVRRLSTAVRRAGYPLILTQRMDIATNSHMCGTIVMGRDPATSVLDPTCRTQTSRTCGSSTARASRRRPRSTRR